MRSDRPTDTSRADETLRFRASWHIFGGRVSVGMGTATVATLTLLALISASRLEESWQWWATIGGLAAGALWLTTYLATAELTVTSDQVVKHRWWVWHTRIRRDRVYGLGAPLKQPLERRVFPVLFLRERDDHGRGIGPRIKLSAWYWEADDLRRIGEVLDVPILDEVLEGPEFERRAPGAVSLRHRRPVWWAFGLVFGGVFAVFWILMAVVWFGASPGSDDERDRAQAQVSQRIVGAQDTRVDALVAALPERTWRDVGEHHRACHDHERREGWKREVVFASDGPVDDTAVSAVARGLESFGYRVEDDTDARPRTLTARPTIDRRDPRGEETTVLIENNSLLVIMASECDVPVED